MVSDTDPAGSLFHFPHHCRILGRFSRNSATWLTPTREWIHHILGATGHPDPHQSENPESNLGSILVETTRVQGQVHLVSAELCVLGVLSSFNFLFVLWNSYYSVSAFGYGDGGCRLWQPVQADSQPKSSGLVLGRRWLGAVLHSSNEPGELSQWLCNDDSTINMVLESSSSSSSSLHMVSI